MLKSQKIILISIADNVPLDFCLDASRLRLLASG